MFTRSFASLALFTSLVTAPFFAATAQENFTLTIKDHQFSPAELVVPADQKIKITIINNDATPEEFESHDLNRDVMVNGNSKASVIIGPLKAGTYNFIGEFHEDTAKGSIIVK